MNYKFLELEFKESWNEYDTIKRARKYFDNWYWVSVVFGEWTYWFEHWLYELAVLEYNEECCSWDICYDSWITTDVLGNLTKEEVGEYMYQISIL